MGSPETVEAQLANLPDDLIRRRVYMLMVQGTERAEVRIFERFDLEDTEGTVTSWQQDHLGDLVTQITDVLVANKGVHCPGEQVKATIEGDRELSIEPPAPAPQSAREAFGPVLAQYHDDTFIQATAVILC